MKIAIVYDSITGNTKLLADTIATLFVPKELAFVGNVKDYQDQTADLFIVGSWTNRGDQVLGIKKLLSSLKSKQIILFGTCGFGGSVDYFNTLEQRYRSSIDSSNQILGCFICQGKMVDSTKERYISLIKDHPEDEHLKVSLKNFEEARTHPDQQDLEHLKSFINHIKKNLESN